MAKIIACAVVLVLSWSSTVYAQTKWSKKSISNLKEEASDLVEQNAKMTQVMVDKVFSFRNWGFRNLKPPTT